MELTKKNRWVEIKNAQECGSKSGFFCLLCGRGTDGKVQRYFCAEKLEPFPNFEDAKVAAKFVASHSLNEDNSKVEIFGPDGNKIHPQNGGSND